MLLALYFTAALPPGQPSPSWLVKIQSQISHFYRFFPRQMGSPIAPSIIFPLLLLLGLRQLQYFTNPFRYCFNSMWQERGKKTHHQTNKTTNKQSKKTQTTPKPRKTTMPQQNLCSDTDALKGLQKTPHHKGGGSHMAKNSKRQGKKRTNNVLFLCHE